MNTITVPEALNFETYDEPVDRVDYDFGLSRRSFVKVLGTGLLIAAVVPAVAQEEGGRRGGFGGSGARTLSARIHLGKDGSITVLTGKVEGGQGARTELSQAAAEELGVPVTALQMLMADTATVPNDGRDVRQHVHAAHGAGGAPGRGGGAPFVS